MDNTIFECQTVTPMFLTGADGSTPELRPPTIKAAMRFWWRAINANLPLAKLHDMESELFGGSGDNEGRSKFNIKISDAKLNTNIREYSPVPHSTTKKFKFPCIDTNYRFIITISSMVHPAQQEYYNNLFIITTILGGYGKRSRRGFGAIEIVKINGNDYNNDCSPHLITSLLNSINAEGFEIDAPSDIIREKYKPNETACYPYIKEIKIGLKYNSYDSILKRIGQASHDCDSLYTGFAEKVGDKSRYASPIYVSVIKCNSNDYRPVITILNLDKNAIELGEWIEDKTGYVDMSDMDNRINLLEVVDSNFIKGLYELKNGKYQRVKSKYEKLNEGDKSKFIDLSKILYGETLLRKTNDYSTDFCNTILKGGI